MSNKTEVDIKVLTPAVDIILNNLASFTEPENIEKYILGKKKNGNPRSVYDILKVKKKKKKYKKYKTEDLDWMFDKKSKGKKKKKKKKNKINLYIGRYL